MIDDLRTQAQHVLNACEAAGADLAECVLRRTEMTEIYAEDDHFDLVRTLYRDALALKVIVDGKKGAYGVNDLRPEAVSAAVDAAVTMAREAEPDPWEDVADEPADEHYEGDTTPADPDAMCDLADGLRRDTARDFPSIVFNGLSVSHARTRSVYANSRGVTLSAYRGGYHAGVTFMASRDGRAGSFTGFGLSLKDPGTPLMTNPLVASEFDATVRHYDATPFSGRFEGTLLMSPDMTGDYLDEYESCLLGDGALITGTSRFRDRLGERVAAPGLTWRIAPFDARFAQADPFTSDGYRSAPVTVIGDGVLESFLLSRYAAARTGRQRALADGVNTIIEPGDTSLDDLIAGIERGLLIRRFSGGSASAAGDLTGVAKTAFLIEDGRVTRPVTETMISLNLVDGLRDLVGMSRETHNDGSFEAPYTAIGGVVISGK